MLNPTQKPLVYGPPQEIVCRMKNKIYEMLDLVRPAIWMVMQASCSQARRDALPHSVGPQSHAY